MNQMRVDLRLETEKLSVTSKTTIHGVLIPVQQIGTKLVFLPVPWMFSTNKKNGFVSCWRNIDRRVK